MCVCCGNLKCKKHDWSEKQQQVSWTGIDKEKNIQIFDNGGWHFTRVISPEEIHKKELDAEHHDEYRASNKNPERI